MKKITKIIVGLLVIVVLVSVGILAYNYFGIDSEGGPPFSWECKKDLTNKTLTLIRIVNTGNFVNWSDVEITRGSATLPTGTIDEGDVITNCGGVVTLVYKLGPGIGYWNFEE
jgi:hypothetical protein